MLRCELNMMLRHHFQPIQIVNSLTTVLLCFLKGLHTCKIKQFSVTERKIKYVYDCLCHKLRTISLQISPFIRSTSISSGRSGSSSTSSISSSSISSSSSNSIYSIIVTISVSQSCLSALRLGSISIF